MLEGHATVNEAPQMGDPIAVLTSDEEQGTAKKSIPKKKDPVIKNNLKVVARGGPTGEAG